MNPELPAEYVAALEKVAFLAGRLMTVAYDDGPEETALSEALAEARQLRHSVPEDGA